MSTSCYKEVVSNFSAILVMVIYHYNISLCTQMLYHEVI